MRGIKLSEEQAGSVSRMRELYLHNLGALMRRRQELSALLKVCGLWTEEATGVPRLSQEGCGAATDS